MATMTTEGVVTGPASTSQPIPVSLTTRSAKHAIPSAKYMLPNDWRRVQLNELLNKVLTYDPPVPFDFIIAGQLLKTSLAKFVSAAGISTESTLEIEYVESVQPPKDFASLPHEDWVADLDLSRQGLYLSACYDSGVRIFSGASANTPLATLNGHDLSVLSTCWLPSASSSTSVIASGGMDRVVRIWSLPSAVLEPATDETSASHGQTTHLLPLHSAPVSTVRGCPSSSKLLTGSWDGLIALWDLSDSSGDRVISSADDIEPVEADVDSAPKKRRRKGPSAGIAPRAVKKVPKTTLRGHSGTVARALFSASQPHQKAVSASHDHTVRGWDLETGTEEWRKEGGTDKCILDLDNCGREAVVTGGMDRTVCFWDARESATHVSLTMYGHRAPVSSVSSSPTAPSSSANPLVLSGSYDGTLKVWDLRSPKSSLFTLQRPAVEGRGAKVMCVGWSADGTLVGSGGEDGKLVLARGNPVGGDGGPATMT